MLCLQCTKTFVGDDRVCPRCGAPIDVKAHGRVLLHALFATALLGIPLCGAWAGNLVADWVMVMSPLWGAIAGVLGAWVGLLRLRRRRRTNGDGDLTDKLPKIPRA